MKKYKVLFWNTDMTGGAGSHEDRYMEIVEARTLDAATTKGIRKAIKSARVLRWNLESVKYLVTEA